jgi:hypothetical protein
MSNATELLRRALAELIDQDETICAEFCGMQPWRSPPIIKAIYDYLDAEPEAEPVAWMFQHEDTGLIDYVDTQQVEWGFEKNNLRWQKIGPVYLHPPRPEPKRKPMTDEEIVDEFGIPRSGTYFIEGVFAGVRFAEKHHSISQRCENS